MDAAVIAAIILIPLGLWGLISPRSQWRVLQAWKYRNPDANEPSDAVYLLTRIGGVVLIVIAIGVVALVATGPHYVS